jgi:hypothetical protein
MSVTYPDRIKPSRAQEILEQAEPDIDPAPQPRGPVTPATREPSDGELLARAER